MLNNKNQLNTSKYVPLFINYINYLQHILKYLLEYAVVQRSRGYE